MKSPRRISATKLSIVPTFVLLVAGAQARGETFQAGPDDYLDVLDSLAPGDILELQAGVYNDGLPVYNLVGTEQAPIVIRGPALGDRAKFLGSNSSNTVRIRDSAYIEIYNLELDGLGRAGDAVNADGNGTWAHHITIENFLIYGYDADQSIVGISTNGCTTWDWTIRRNVIRGAGTGMYLGNSPGNNPFIGGLIEYNVITDTIGYNIQIKQQNARPAIADIPQGDRRTIIRHNVFQKTSSSSTGDDARPNLLVGHFPLSGAGANDRYEIYGNFFYENATEALFQGEGNVSLYANIFVNSSGPAVAIQPHNDRPRRIRVFNNTVISTGRPILVSGGESGYTQLVAGNAVFSNSSISGGEQVENVSDIYASADQYLVDPLAALGDLDAYPRAGMLRRQTFDSSDIDDELDSGLDFNGDPYDRAFRGAYAGEGTNPGWRLAIEIKPEIGDNGASRPAPPANLPVD